MGHATYKMIAAWVLLTSTTARAEYDIGGPEDGVFAAMTNFVQDIVNFIDGPVALAFSFFSIVGLAITWAVAPKALQAMGMALRIVIAIIVILNVGVWITAFQAG